MQVVPEESWAVECGGWGRGRGVDREGEWEGEGGGGVEWGVTEGR